MVLAALGLMDGANAIAAPTAVVTAQSSQTLANATRAIQGHPAANKVFLIPDEPVNGVASTTAYVVPKLSSASQSMSPIGTPDCTRLQGLVDDVNHLTDAMATVAITGVDKSLDVMRALDTAQAFMGAHIAELQTAAMATSKLNDIDYALAPLYDEKQTADNAVAQRNGSPVRQNIVDRISAAVAQGKPDDAQTIRVNELQPYDAKTATFQAASDKAAAQIAKLEAQRQVAVQDPAFAAAWAVQAQGDALLDVALSAEDDLRAYEETNMQEALDAVNAAKTNYNDFAQTDAAYGESDFPVWDADVVNLVTANRGLRNGVNFVPNAVENIAWTIDQGAIDVAPPFQYDIYMRLGTELVSLGNFAPLGDGPMPGSTVITTTRPSDVTVQQTVVGQDDTHSYVRQAKVLGVPKPHVAVRLGIGAYCGAITEQRVQRTSPPASDGLSAAVSYSRYSYTRSDPTTIFTRTAHGDYETPVMAPPMQARCSIDSEDYLTRFRKLPHDTTSPFWSWQNETDWGPSLVQRLKNNAIRCELPDQAILTDDALLRTARAIDEVAVAEAATRFTAYANGGVPVGVLATPSELDAFKRSVPDQELWSPTMASFCGGTPTCHLAAADPQVFEQQCTTMGNQTSCTKQYLSVWYWFRRTGAYYKPLQLQSQVAFQIKH